MAMNEQKAPHGIEWTRVYGRSGYTWNPITGCLHDCKWTMPDGQTAQCYAKTVAEGVARDHYPQGFEHHTFHPQRLDEPLKLKTPAGIFLDSMSDLMGHWVERDQIEQVLFTCREAHWHTFQLLTKNAPRLLHFQFPSNVWVGVSSPPDSFMGKPLMRAQQVRMLETALKTLQQVQSPVRWMSFEPLSWNAAEVVKRFPQALTWAVIGAASNGRQEYPPSERDLAKLLDVLDQQQVPVFFKGNLRSSPAAKPWRENFPALEAREPEPAALWQMPLL